MLPWCYSDFNCKQTLTKGGLLNVGMPDSQGSTDREERKWEMYGPYKINQHHTPIVFYPNAFKNLSHQRGATWAHWKYDLWRNNKASRFLHKCSHSREHLFIIFIAAFHEDWRALLHNLCQLTLKRWKASIHWWTREHILLISESTQAISSPSTSCKLYFFPQVCLPVCQIKAWKPGQFKIWVLSKSWGTCRPQGSQTFVRMKGNNR